MTDPRRAAEALIRRRYAAFNAGDAPATLALLIDDARREPDHGAPRCGRAAFAAHGRHTATDEGLPEATGQAYVLPAGTFFTPRHKRIAQAAPSGNLPDGIAQVSA